MRRRLLAVLSILALTLCVGRVASWASPAANAHSCCQAPKGKTAPAMEQCCPDAAATISPRVSSALVVTAFVPAAPRLSASQPATSLTVAPAAPPGASGYLATAPARAPPLA